MKLANSEIGIKGLGRDLVNEGYGDMKVKIKGEEVLCVMSILAYGNKTFKKLIEDDKFSGCLELYERCDIESFLEIEKYYSGGTMELNEDNVCGILSFCIYCDDSFLLTQCKNYLKNHLNDIIMIELFNALHEINNKYVNDLKEMCEEYIQKNGYKYLKDDELLLKLKIENLEFILNCNNLIIENENWLLNRLIKWKNEIKKLCGKDKGEEEIELKEEFIKLLREYIDFKKINVKELSNETANEIKEMNLYNEICRVNHISIDLKEIKNDKAKEIIYKYYIEEDKTEIEEKDVKMLNENNLPEIISILLNIDEVKLNEIGLLMIIDSKIDYKNIKNDNKSRLLLKLLSQYTIKPDDRIIKCLCLFVVDEKNIIIIEGLCGKELLFKILNFHNYLNEESKNLLIDYINEIRLTEEEKNGLSYFVSDKSIVDRILIERNTSFSYPKSHYSITINEEFEIIPSFNGERWEFTINEEFAVIPSLDGEKCEFAINPSLPEGLILDKETGLIKGKVDKAIEKKEYEIACKNNTSEKKFKISLEIINVDMNGSCKILIRTLTGKIIVINANPDCTIEYFKKKIFKKEGIPPDQQRLVYSGKYLEDNLIISDYGIKSGSSINLILRLRGD